MFKIPSQLDFIIDTVERHLKNFFITPPFKEHVPARHVLFFAFYAIINADYTFSILLFSQYVII